MTVSQATLGAIKAEPLSAVIEGLGIAMKRIGREFVTLCPWHDDTNPSLTINDQKGFCFCHCCRNGGDIIDYIQKVKGLSMPEAAEVAANILGVEFRLHNEDPEEAIRRKRERQTEINRLEQQQSLLKANINSPEASQIRQILKDRNLSPKACREFGIGYAENGFFAKRITIPIYNHTGTLVGFTGRTVVEGEPAKYKNSSDSILFNKKSLIFNEHRAYPSAVEAGSIIFVEGHLDVISLWQAGICNVVAAQGTGAPDPSVIKRLSRNIKNFVLCFDGDAGGKRAAEQFISVAGPFAQRGEISINVVTLPDGKDPDELIREGEDLYLRIANAPSWLDWTIDVWAAQLDKDDTAMITDVERKLRSLIDNLHSKALRTHYIDRASRVLAKNDKAAKSLASGWDSGAEYVERNYWQPRTPAETRTAAERRLVRLFVHRPERRSRLEPLMDGLTNPALIWLWKRLQELQQCSTVDLTPSSIMAVVAVAEPHFMDQLRPIVRPNVKIDDADGVLQHLESVIRPSEIPDAELLH
jgi:DNA primase